MHTMIVRMSVDPSRAELVARHLREDIIGWATHQPGFVSGQWLLAPERDQGMGVVIFASEQDASAAAQGPRGYPRDDNRAWNIENVAVYHQVTAA